MSTHGKMSYFDPKIETWSSYSERLNFYFKANDIEDDDKKKSILLTVCGPATFNLLKSLLQPASLEEKSYRDYIDVLKTHHDPVPSAIIQRYKFNSRVRNTGETVAGYVAALKSLGEHCEYGEHLHDMIRDRLVCGINDARIQRRLLQETKLTYKAALEIAQAMELADRDTHDLQSQAHSPTAAVQTLGESEVRRGSKAQVSKVTTTSRSINNCYRCGGNHSPATCKFKQAECYLCKKIGHIAKRCRGRKSSQQQPVKRSNSQSRPSRSKLHSVVEEVSSDDSLDNPAPTDYSLFTLQTNSKPIVVSVKVNKVVLDMEVDTGAALSVISEVTFKNNFSFVKLDHCNIVLSTYTGQKLSVLGKFGTKVEYESKQYQLPLIVVKGNGPSLLGRNWLEHIKLNWVKIHIIKNNASVDTVLQKHRELFSSQLGTLHGFQAKLNVNQDAHPRFFKPRPVAYALKDKVDKELTRLQDLRLIVPVQSSEWAAPIVPVVKRDGSIRICGDYKVTANQVLTPDTYPLPRVEDLFAVLAGGKIFSKLDLSHAYQQLQLHDDSKVYTTINTHKGLYQYQRLPFGISTAPSLFQRTMETLLQGLPKVCVYLDDILVAGADEADHLHNLDKVLTKLETAGLTLKKSKCEFARFSVEYLGHIIDADGLHPSDTKVAAIRDAPEPSNITELKSFLGMLNYYNKFLPNLSTVLTPLYSLLQKNVRWKWSTSQIEAFNTAKELLQSSSLLVHYDTGKPLTLSCDASPYGVGAVLGHIMEDGSEKPIAYISRTLAPAEKKYSQLEKEALAIVFAVKRFHQYLYGRHFMLYSDHQPLKYLLSESRQIPQMASSRIQRWALTLSAYQYTIKYKPGAKLANADALSRLPLPESPDEVPIPGDLHYVINHLAEVAVTAKQIELWTSKDPVLSRVRRLVLSGWTIDDPEPAIKPYFNRSSELSVLDGCILWGARVVIPSPGRKTILQELHLAHPGISKMKALARSYVWWPGLDSEIEELVKHCHLCQLHRPDPAKAPLHPWEFPSYPWGRVHIDHAGPFMGQLFLLLVDAHSKWVEVHTVKSTSSDETIKTLKKIFATHGLPKQIVSDNGTSFTSAEFSQFVKRNGIQHSLVSPYHPSSNGLAERAVQTFKNSMKKLEGPMESRILSFLFRYRMTPQCTTGLSPAEMLMNRRLRSRLDLIHPDVSRKVEQKQDKLRAQPRKERHYEIGDLVYTHNYGSTRKWIPAEIVQVRGPVSYKLRLQDNKIVRRHVDQIRTRFNDNVDYYSNDVIDDGPTVARNVDNDLPLPTPISIPASTTGAVPTVTEPPRRSSRTRKPVSRFGPYVNH